MTSERSRAFVPGHVTAFFSAHPDADPAVAGSRGAGLTLTDGVETLVVPGADDHTAGADDHTAGADDHAAGADDHTAGGGSDPRSGNPAGGDGDAPTLTLDGEGTEMGVVDDVLDALGVRAATDRVALESDLPVGAGFGVSGAAALGAALAANDAFDLGRSENELVRIAHVAEVERGTGLGDVVAQARGGVPIRIEPGAPGHGELDGIPANSRVEYVTFGELSTEAVLAGDTAALSDTGERALTRLRRDPRLSTLMDASREFAADADLLVPEVAAAIDDVTAAGGAASMAMLGRTVFALGSDLSAAGYDPAVCRTHTSGAWLVDETSPSSRP